jgi:hypothetical protein
LSAETPPDIEPATSLTTTVLGTLAVEVAYTEAPVAWFVTVIELAALPGTTPVESLTGIVDATAAVLA